MGAELEDVEKPFVAQLQALGWTHIEIGHIDWDRPASNRFTVVDPFEGV